MAYCRTSDVYLYQDNDGAFYCCSCRLESDIRDGRVTKFQSRTDTVAHLREHQQAGHQVSEAGIARLEEEIQDYGD